jgi:hypothetical protein
MTYSIITEAQCDCPFAEKTLSRHGRPLVSR